MTFQSHFLIIITNNDNTYNDSLLTPLGKFPFCPPQPAGEAGLPVKGSHLRSCGSRASLKGPQTADARLKPGTFQSQRLSLQSYTPSPKEFILQPFIHSWDTDPNSGNKEQGTVKGIPANFKL